MTAEVKSISSCVLLFLLQVVLDCFINLGIYVHICIIPLIIIAIPYKWHVSLTMPAAFLIGLAADFAAGGVLGVNSAAAVAVAAFRNPLFRTLVATDGSLPAQTPSTAASGAMPYLKFLSATVLVFTTCYVLVDGLSLRPAHLVFGRIAASGAVSIAVCYWLNLLLDRKETKTNGRL